MFHVRPHPGQAQSLTRPSATLSHPMGEGQRGRITCRLTRKPATGFAGRLSAKPERCERCSFSPGEKVRMRASVTTIRVLGAFEFLAPSESGAKATRTPNASRLPGVR